MPVTRIKISLKTDLLGRLDIAAKEESMCRSEFIRSAVHDRLKRNDEFNQRLAAAAANTGQPTEEVIFDLLKLKDRQRQAAQWRREWHREMRQRSLERKCKRQA